MHAVLTPGQPFLPWFLNYGTNISHRLQFYSHFKAQLWPHGFTVPVQLRRIASVMGTIMVIVFLRGGPRSLLKMEEMHKCLQFSNYCQRISVNYQDVKNVLFAHHLFHAGDENITHFKRLLICTTTV